MKTLIPMCAAVALFAGSALAEPVVGKPSPAFKAIDTSGEEHSLADFRGKTVVLEWTNHQCPYVQKHYETDNMQALQRDATSDGVVWLTIISSAPGKQGHVTALEADELTQARGAEPTAVLFDPDGRIGKAYAARTTPHMYVIDESGTLVYMGGIDDRPTSRHSDVEGARNYVREALGALAEGKAIDAAQTRAYGCSIKYKS